MSRLTVAILLLALAAAIGGWGVLPQWRQVGEGRAAVRELQSLHDELTTIAQNRDALIAEYNTIPESDLAKLQQIAPANPKTTDVLTGLEELARRSGLSLRQVDFTGSAAPTAALVAPVAARRHSAIPVNLSLAGSYESFRSFVTALEQDLRIFDTDEVIFASPGGRDATISLKGRIYYRK